MKMHHTAIYALSTALYVAAIHIDAVELYVSPTGSDSNSGGIDSPWATVARALEAATPGDTINLRAGTYAELVNVNKSGSPGNYLTIKSFEGEKAILDATSLAPPKDSTTSVILIEDQSHVRVQGLEIRNLATSDLNSLVIGIHVTGHGSTIELRGNTVHHIENNDPVKGGNAHGIAVYGTNATRSINNLLVDANTVRNCILGWSESLVLNGNVENFTVSNNTIHDNNNIGIDLIGWEGTCPDPAYDQTRNGTVAGNTVYNITSYGNPAYGTERSAAGIYVDGGRNLVLERNTVHHCDFGFEVASEHGGKTTTEVTVRDNLVYLNNITGIGFGGYDSTRGVTLNCVFQHNTLFQNDTTRSGSGEVYIQQSHDNTFSCNIIFANDQNILFTNFFDAASSHHNNFDYNVYLCPGGADNLSIVWQNTYYTTFRAYQQAAGQDPHSLFADPRFVDAASAIPNLHLQAGSPAIDAGDPTFTPGAGETDFDGNQRVVDGRDDCGAYEYGSTPPSPVKLTTASNPADGGGTEPATGEHTYNVGDSVGITAIPFSGYRFLNWTSSANASVADAASSSTTVTLSGDATVTANFSISPVIDTYLAYGSALWVKASDVGMANFTKKPKINAVVQGKSCLFAVIGFSPLEAMAEWKRKIRLYDKGDYDKSAGLGQKLQDTPVTDLALDEIKVATGTGDATLQGKFFLANLTVTSVDGSPSAAGDNFTVHGMWFGSKAPNVLVEFLKNGSDYKYAKCGIDKNATYTYQNAKGSSGASCMKIRQDDGGQEALGASVVSAFFPKLKATDTPTGYIILDNGVGLVSYRLNSAARRAHREPP